MKYEYGYHYYHLCNVFHHLCNVCMFMYCKSVNSGTNLFAIKLSVLKTFYI